MIDSSYQKQAQVRFLKDVQQTLNKMKQDFPNLWDMHTLIIHPSYGELAQALGFQKTGSDSKLRLEHSLIYWLAINREAVDLTELKSDIISSINLPNLLEILESLYRRSLIEKSRDTHLQGKFFDSSIISTFTLQAAFMEYVTAKFIEQICQEIVKGEVSLFASHALIKATSPDYIRESQIRLILTPILDKLKLLLGNPSQIESQLINIINQFRKNSPQIAGYAGGNAVNLLANLSPKISECDFSHITIWQAYLQDLTLHQVNFQNSSFAKSIFTEAFGIIFSLAFSQDDQLLATGSIDGEIYVWRWRDNQQT